MKKPFNKEKYIELQSESINKRINQFDGLLYLEFGGKLFDDYHASRVLPGFEPDMKIKMLSEIKDKIEIVITINSNDIEKHKFRDDLGITYDEDVLRLIDAFRNNDLCVNSVVITQYQSIPVVNSFKSRLEKLGIKVYLHYSIENYPNDVSLVVSDEGYGKNDFIEVNRSLIVVTAPGPGSGKMSFCLSQLYHHHKRGVKAGYAKFETFPIHNIPLNHPVNIAYEAATTNLNDVNMIDPFHMEAYGKVSVNYNRDVEVFPLLKTLLNKITNEDIYESPTDMGVNMAGYCIDDDDAVCKASNDEIVRRYLDALVSYRKEKITKDVVEKNEILVNKAKLNSNYREIVQVANTLAEETNKPAVAIKLLDGRIITGKTTSLLGASSAALLNAVKTILNISDDVLLISPEIIEPIRELKVNILGNNNPRLHLDETLIALSIASLKDENAKKALNQLAKLECINVHSSVILSEVDVNVFKKLNMFLTQTPTYQSKKLYHKK